MALGDRLIRGNIGGRREAFAPARIRVGEFAVEENGGHVICHGGFVLIGVTTDVTTLDLCFSLAV